MPLSANGLCEADEHDAEVEPVALEQQRRAGRGQDAAEQRLAARGGHARGDGRLQHLPRLARIADHEHARRLGGHACGRCAGERQRELRGQELPGDPPDTVSAEELASQGQAEA